MTAETQRSHPWWPVWERRTPRALWLIGGTSLVTALVLIVLTATGWSAPDPDYISVPIIIGVLALSTLFDRRTGLIVAILAGTLAAIVPGDFTLVDETFPEIALRLCFLIAMSVVVYRVIVILRDRAEHVERQLDTVRRLATEMTALHAMTAHIPADRAAVERQILEAALRLCRGTRGALHLRGDSEADWRVVRLSVSPNGSAPADVDAITAPLTNGRELIGILEITPGTAPLDPREGAEALSVYARDAALTLEHVALQERAEQLAVAGERGRIARDLHDGLVQSLAGIAFRLEHYRDQLGPGAASVRMGLDTTAADVKAALAEARAVIHGLRDVPAAASLRDVIDLVTRRADLSVTLDLPPHDPPLTAIGRETLYKVAREGVQNVIKHAGAKHVTVQLTDGPDGCTLTIADDGCGFPADQPPSSQPGSRFGIRGMEERAAACGGRLAITPRPGGGTLLTLTVPVEGERHDDSGVNGR
jgi:signal transduction histidine kinase